MSAVSEVPPFERLSRDLLPVTYHLHLKPDLSEFTFSGRVQIHLSVAQSTSHITLHAAHLTVQRLQVHVRAATGEVREVECVRWALRAHNETLVINLAQALPVGAQVELSIEYKGELNDTLRGFYRTAQGPAQYGAVCHFEATGARHAFPCWDEPSFRAQFQVNIQVADASLVILSNMPEQSRELGPEGGVRVAFQPTPSIPTYLLCWSLGQYDFIEDVTPDEVTVRVYTPVGKKEEGAFALEVAVKALRYYKEFFGVPYRLPKMDLIALSDFAIGAMENWGLLTFRERLLLYDAQTSSAMIKQYVALIVAHEVAHQWFGNLVTIEWWTHLWLKEGYATWIEFLCVDHLFPEWNFWTQFITDTLNPALELDCLDNSHPIEVKVENPAQIDEIFDLISYNKGASIIRMLFNWIGETNFRRGMKAYLDRHAYGNATTEDLWKALEEASGSPVGTVMSTWTQKKGYPLIRASLCESKNELSVKQAPFCIGKGSSGGVSDQKECSLWEIPLSLTTKMSPQHSTMSIVLKGESEVVFLPENDNRSWLNLNPGKVGYFRVHYSPELMKRFVPAIEDRSLPVQDRIGLLQDYTDLCHAGIVPSVELIQLIEKYRDNEDFTVWDAVVASVKALQGLMQSDPECLDSFNFWQRWLFQPAMKRLGLDARSNDSHIDMLLRSLLHWSLVRANDEETLNDGLERFEAHRNGSALIPADLKSSMYACALRLKGQEVFDSLIQIAKDTDSHEAKGEVYNALGQSQDSNLLQQALEYGLSPAVRLQDTRSVLSSVSSESVLGRNLCWSFFKANASEIGKRYKTGGLLTRLIKAVTCPFSTLEEAAEIEAFFESHPFPGAQRSIKQAIESVRLRAHWIQRDLESVKTYLIDFQTKQASTPA
ncbi:hypothetical protein TCAL_04130 [Tigriopus californicus]|uniref:Aminopeptidase n=1 Tax=Tigriopus californicus TaxID=6832 RepID=A0A553NUE6_TIGCA|nr:puromycin-sensitive aminopeptidase-like [Tigriopus californicus]TRY69055.1 hypothetical protein TCAL_04130 [Tigriopus californicus]|eukprot:TCALIF_04130-PA protein Name:"Similar to NPEPPS Puromycin-sensitive aminopeptidase (Homo sapiens)" AED:0.01 eAED:0.01 QI:72/1/1/1/1/1/2/139/884